MYWLVKQDNADGYILFLWINSIKCFAELSKFKL